MLFQRLNLFKLSIIVRINIKLANIIIFALYTKSKEKKSKSEIKSFTLKDGSKYTGEARGKKPHGKGRMAYPNGDFYEGTFVKGKRNGKGVYVFKDGERYEGDFVNGKPQEKVVNIP